jgi:hypothetical protein
MRLFSTVPTGGLSSPSQATNAHARILSSSLGSIVGSPSVPTLVATGADAIIKAEELKSNNHKVNQQRGQTRLQLRPGMTHPSGNNENINVYHGASGLEPEAAVSCQDQASEQWAPN